jgi:hypothetical protein
MAMMRKVVHAPFVGMGPLYRRERRPASGTGEKWEILLKKVLTGPGSCDKIRLPVKWGFVFMRIFRFLCMGTGQPCREAVGIPGRSRGGYQ